MIKIGKKLNISRNKVYKWNWERKRKEREEESENENDEWERNWDCFINKKKKVQKNIYTLYINYIWIYIISII